MTKSIIALCGLLLFTLCLPHASFADDGARPRANTPLPDGVVARVAGRDLSFEGLCKTAAQQKLHGLTRPTSTTATVLRQLMEERIVKQEVQRLGLQVTEADVTKHMARIDKQVRERSGGNTTIRDIMRQKGTSLSEMRSSIAHQLRQVAIAKHASNLGDTLPKNSGERLSQLKVVLDKVVKRTKKDYFVPTAFQQVPSKGQPGWIASVQVDPSVSPDVITIAQFGRALILRLSGSEVREVLDRECKTGLMSASGVTLTDADFDSEAAHARKIWEIERRLSSQEAFSTVTYDNFMEAKYGLTLEDMKLKRYYRGHFGLLRRFRATVKEEQVRKEWEAGKDTTWGVFVLVWDVQIEFKQENARFTRATVRIKKQAVKLAREVGRQRAAGIPFEQLVRNVNGKKDPTFLARKRRLRPTDADYLLYRHAVEMKDGDLSSPIETLAHLHVLKRIRHYPAPSYEEVRPLVKELIARREARKWLEEQILDPRYVRVRWPLPERGGVDRVKPKHSK